MVAHGETGRAGEAAAERVYASNGYRVLARNWRCRLGELDLVLRRGETLVFCEVKSRRGTAHGGGWQAVTGRKRAKLRALAQVFLLSTGVQATDVRFDVASVAVRSTSTDVELFQDAF
jgi:putative endonuclease